MPTSAYINGDLIQPADAEEEPYWTQIELDTDIDYECRTCGQDLTETPNGFETDSGYSCPGDDDLDDDLDDDDGFGRPHDPRPKPLAWCNNADIRLDHEADEITTSISVADPRGGFVFTIRRVPADSGDELAGRLIMHLPYADEPGLHTPLTQIGTGAYLIGDTPTPRSQRRINDVA